MLLPADSVDVCPNPTAGGEWFTIRCSVVDAVEENGPIWKFESLKLVFGVLSEPVIVFGGLGRDGCLGAKCYCGRPGICYLEDGSTGPPPANSFFVVYTEPLSGGTERVWDWGWRKEDPAAPGKPIDWETFDRGTLWPPI